MYLLSLVLVGASLGADVGVFHNAPAESTQSVQPQVIDFATYNGASNYVVAHPAIQQASHCTPGHSTVTSCAVTGSGCVTSSCGQAACGPQGSHNGCHCVAGCGSAGGCQAGCRSGGHGCECCDGNGYCQYCNGHSSTGWQYGYADDDCNNGCCWLDECWNDHLMRYCVGPGDLYPHYAYYPKFHGYYYFRPYNHIHVERDAALAAAMGGDVRAPYSTEFLKPMFASFSTTNPVPPQAVKRPFDAKLPNLEDLVNGQGNSIETTPAPQSPMYEPPAPAPLNPLDGPGI